MVSHSFQKSRNYERLSELAYFVGALRDGGFTRDFRYNIYRIRIYQKNREWVEKLAHKFNNLFGKQPFLEVDKRSGVWCLRVDSKDVYEELVKVCDYPGNQLNWKTPEWILESDENIRKSYIRGFFDAEGGISHVDKNRVKSKNLGYTFHRLINKFFLS